MNTKTYTTEAICLRGYEYGEADRILHFYAPEHGRISVIAKGVRKSTSKLAGACTAMNISELHLAKGANLDRLCQYQPVATFSGIRSDILKLAYGQLFLEMVDLGATENDMDSHLIYQRLRECLETLDRARDDHEVLQSAFFFQLAMLESTGYHPTLTQCMVSEEPLNQAELYYCFSPSLGGIVRPELRSHHPGRWVNVSTSTLTVLGELAEGRLTDTSWRKANPAKIQKFLRFYFEELFERPLHSMDFVFSLLEPARLSQVSV